MSEQPDLEPKWPRLGALASIRGREGVWSIWSRGGNEPRPSWIPADRGKWWLIPVDAEPSDREDRAVLLHESKFGPYEPANETGALL